MKERGARACRRPLLPPDRLLLLLCLAATGILLAPGLGGEFTTDDLYVYRIYTHPGGGVDWTAVLADLTGPWQANRFGTYYRPLVSLSLGLDFALGGGRAAFTLAGNLLIHLLSTALLFLIARRWFDRPLPAALAALLFGLHPVCVEGVCWGVGRSEVLTTGWMLLGGWLLLRARAGGRYPLGSVLLCLPVLLTKETGLLYPLVPLLLDVGAPGRRPARLLPRFSPYLAMAAIMTLYLLWRILLFGTLLGETRLELSPAPAAVLGGYGRLLRFFFLPTSPAMAGLRLLPLLLFLGLTATILLPGGRWTRAGRSALLLGGALLLMVMVHQNPCDPAASIRGGRWAYTAAPFLALCLVSLLPPLRRLWTALLLLAPLLLLGPPVRRETAAWGDAGHAARTLRRDLVEKAARLGLGKQGAPLPVINTLRSFRGVEIYHAGEFGLAAAPPFLPRRIHLLSLEGMWTSGRHLEALPFLGDPPRLHLAGTDLDPTRVRGMIAELRAGRDLPTGPLALDDAGPGPLTPAGRIEAAGVEEGRTLLVFASAVDWGICPLAGKGGYIGGYPLPAPFRECIERLLRSRGAGDTVAFYLENRTDPGDPATARARTDPVYRMIGE